VKYYLRKLKMTDISINVANDLTGLKSVIENTNFYAKGYVWKGRKIRHDDGTIEQEEVVLMDATEEQLNGYHAHCISMLYNKDHQNPGRYPLLQIIQSQKDRCGVELFLRESEAKGTSRYTIIDSIKKAVLYSGIKDDELRSMTLDAFVSVESQYSKLPIKLVQDGCTQRLGKFDKSHITLTFILKQGLKVTDEEDQQLTEYTTDAKGGQVKRNVLEVVRERLNIAAHMKLKTDSKGLNYTQLRAMLNLRNRFYNELTVEQLKTLRYRILFALEDDVMFHIQQWETRLNQIKEVAKLRGIDLGVQV
jgi:hypothetical protein